MRATLIRYAAFMSIALFLPDAYGAVPPGLREEGLYIDDVLSQWTTASFMVHFTSEGQYQSQTRYWTTRNNWWPGVDWFDWVYYTGHGCSTTGGNYAWYGVTMYNGDCVDLLSAGDSSHGGYGNRLKYLVSHSCETVASPYDDWQAISKWLEEPGSIFDGLHILMGFRTQADMYTGLNIADEMGRLLNEDYPTLIVWNWMNAVETYGSPDGYLDEYSIYAAYLSGHFYEPAYSSFWDVYGGSQSGSYDSPSLYAIYSVPR
jgi:hypothetical protein